MKRKHKNLALHTPSFIFGRVRTIAKSDYSICHVCLAAWNNSAPSGWIFMKFDIFGFSKICENFQVDYILTRIAGTLHEVLCTFINILLNSSQKEEIFRTIFIKKIKTHILCTVTFSEYRAVYEVMQKKNSRARLATDANTERLKLFACRIPKARISTHTHNI